MRAKWRATATRRGAATDGQDRAGFDHAGGPQASRGSTTPAGRRFGDFARGKIMVRLWYGISSRSDLVPVLMLYFAV